MDWTFRFDLWYSQLKKSPKNAGTVEGCVLRTGHGQRATPDSLELVPGEGIQGDSWKTHKHSTPENEVALINVHVLRSLAENEAQMPLSGDNLHVDLELSEANLPVGTKLKIGTAELEISPMVHRPCRHFDKRFGPTAAKKVARANKKGHRGRGVLCIITKAGRISVGDKIEVVRQSESVEAPFTSR